MTKHGKKTAVLHIGLPKTGSTSLQFLLGENRIKLKSQNAEYFIGSLPPHGYNHGELYLSALRDGVTTFGTQKFSYDQTELYEQTRGRIARFVNRSRASLLLFSAEGLSFLRTRRELRKLRSLFPSNLDFRVILVERDAAEWLNSWRKQILSNPERGLSADPDSALYVEPDTWLVDFEQLKQAYRSEFGNLTTLPYRREGLISAVLTEIGIEPPANTAIYRKKSGPTRAGKGATIVQRALKRVSGTFNRLEYRWRYGR